MTETFPAQAACLNAAHDRDGAGALPEHHAILQNESLDAPMDSIRFEFLLLNHPFVDLILRLGLV
jgi:hypothetical protein